jgi:hypothetical protein
MPDPSSPNAHPGRPLSDHSSPTLRITITETNWQHAVRSSSGTCLIADAIKEQYPQLSAVQVDMTTVRATDRERGVRYVYLTPEPAQLTLVHFDQGWKQPPPDLVIKRAVQVFPITRHKTGPYSAAAIIERRAARQAELETKEAAGEPLDPPEKRVLTRFRNAPPPVERPTARGPAKVKVYPSSGPHGGATIVGGEPLPQGQGNPNLLRGTNRHFGAKMAKPGLAWEEAVAKAAGPVAEAMADAIVAERLALLKRQT